MASGDAQNIPIDIHLGQLSDWIVTRRHCPKDWIVNLQKIREKLAVLYPAVLTALPNLSVETEGLPQLASELTYLHCKTLSQALADTTEHGGKNLLGQYQSSVMKDLAEVLKLYEKDSIYLAETAQVLYRNITYDVPFLKKQMQKLDQTAAELSKKRTDSLKSATDFRDQYQKECASLHRWGCQAFSSGVDIRDELLTGAKILPQLYDNIATKTAVLEKVCRYVEEFITAVHKGEWVKDQSGKSIFAFIYII
ncbi:putative CDK5RAP3-like protein [Hypsibius exemplaris]|uniref:CDK5RAP3-like protein n=1 Tax=Hypsibius exemplaris TaxID=2072580 RepID=A0A1W0WNL1_HYPEX|nr:putative CDK5RAP3-like protein [Hypsibius exemplaris]